MNETIIGIDLGTTNSEVAVIRQNQVIVLDVSPGRKTLPSVVGIADEGSIMVGEAAKNQYILYPERTVKSIKRRMGSDEHVVLGDQAYSPQEISAMILKRLKEIAEASLGTPVHKAVITVPAYFSDAQRQATRDAGEIAGLEVVRMINEPTAAALAYNADQKEQKRVLVFDLGGGTFDVSVVSIAGDIVEVLASHGDNHLGGDDFDARIVEHIVDHLRSRGVDVSASRQALARITRAAETAKIALSDQPFYMIEEEYLLEQDGVPVNLSLELSRDDYETLIASYIDQTLVAVHTALKSADLMASAIDTVLLVGGASRTPLIGRRLEAELGLQVRADIDPELCVASGAAIQAAIQAGGDIASVLVDITPYTFGTSALGELDGMPYPYLYVPLIRKNTPIPVTKSEVFCTVEDYQTTVEVNIFQGEAKDALENIKIGAFTVENLSKVPAGNRIVLKLGLDINGILKVSATEKNTGLEKSITIDNAISRFQSGELEAARERVNALFSDGEKSTTQADEQDDGISAQHRQTAQQLIVKAERLLEKANPDDRDDMINGIEAINDALQDSDEVALAAASEALSELLFYLES